MNKYIAIVSLAVAYFVAAAAYPVDPGWEDVMSQASASPNDSEEINGLEGKFSVFSDFCLSTRDEILTDVRKNSNGLAGNIFLTFFSSAEKLGQEAIQTQQNAAERLEGQIRDPSKPIDQVDESNEVDSIIADGQRKIQENPGQPRSFFQGIVSTIAATHSMVSKQVVSKLNELKAGLGMMTATGLLKDACDRIESYDRQINERFEHVKSELADQDASLAGVTIEQVNCVTARRVVRLDGICKFAKGVKEPLMKVLRTRN